MKEFADKNGFTIENFGKKGGFVDTYDALNHIKITPEMMKERRRRLLIEAMPRYVPPALELMKRNYYDKEPVRTGFNQGLLQVTVKNNYEAKRVAQGP